VSILSRKKKVDWSKIDEGVRVIAKYKGELVGGVFLMDPGGSDKKILHVNLDDDEANYRKINRKDVTVDTKIEYKDLIKLRDDASIADAPSVQTVTKPSAKKEAASVSPLKSIVPDRPDMKIRVGSRVWVSTRNTTLPGIVNKIKSKGRYFCVDVEGDDLPNRSFTRDEIVRVLS